jgi:hypothetical protein
LHWDECRSVTARNEKPAAMPAFLLARENRKWVHRETDL